jgi:serine/threonine-protein kinase
VHIFDFGADPDGLAWIAMELLEGEPLGERIAKGALSEHEVVRVAREVLAALEAAHAQRLVHRDLKPDNVFLSRVPGVGDSVKVLDFGIAKALDAEGAQKLTATGMLIGTPLYMAPEQAGGRDVDERSDLYSLGVVLYEALTGRVPFEAKNYSGLVYAVMSLEPQPVEMLRPGVTPDASRARERWQRRSRGSPSWARRRRHPRILRSGRLRRWRRRSGRRPRARYPRRHRNRHRLDRRRR